MAPACSDGQAGHRPVRETVREHARHPVPASSSRSASTGTAGYADMTDEHMEALKKRKVSILTVIFGDGDEECEALAPFGPVMKLDDVVEACGGGAQR